MRTQIARRGGKILLQISKTVRFILSFAWALLRYGLARAGIAALWFFWWLGFGIGAVGVAGCIGSYVGRDALADYIERQGFKRPRSVSPSRLF